MLESEFDMALGQMDYAERLTIEPGKRIGKPCIRVLRMAVYECARLPGVWHHVPSLTENVSAAYASSGD